MRKGKNGIYKEHNCSPFLQKIRVVLKGNLHPAVEQERTSVKKLNSHTKLINMKTTFICAFHIKRATLVYLDELGYICSIF
jgi:hypothetical protein